MTNRAVPDAVRRFILTSIPSVPFLEALLLLRSDPSRSWTPAHVAARLYVGDQDALELLQELHQAGMAERAEDGGFLYRPRSGELAGTVDELARTYTRHLVGITDLIHSRLEKRARQFADAFRWRKEGG